MDHVWVALIAASIAYVVNSFVVWENGPAALIAITPLIEEVLKSLLSVVTASSLVMVHSIFGMLEAIYDLATGGGLVAAFLSLISHAGFGATTSWAYNWSGSITLAIVLSSGMHTIWNVVVMGRAAKVSGSD